MHTYARLPKRGHRHCHHRLTHPLSQTPTPTHTPPSIRLIAHALDVRAKDLGMTVEELRALPPGRPRRSKHDDMTCLVRLCLWMVSD